MEVSRPRNLLLNGQFLQLEELMEKSQEEFGNLASSVNSSLIGLFSFIFTRNDISAEKLENLKVKRKIGLMLNG